jgi:hypothetical protein
MRSEPPTGDAKSKVVILSGSQGQSYRIVGHSRTTLKTTEIKKALGLTRGHRHHASGAQGRQNTARGMYHDGYPTAPAQRFMICCHRAYGDLVKLSRRFSTNEQNSAHLCRGY